MQPRNQPHGDWYAKKRGEVHSSTADRDANFGCIIFDGDNESEVNSAREFRVSRDLRDLDRDSCHGNIRYQAVDGVVNHGRGGGGNHLISAGSHYSRGSQQPHHKRQMMREVRGTRSFTLWSSRMLHSFLMGVAIFSIDRLQNVA